MAVTANSLSQQFTTISIQSGANSNTVTTRNRPVIVKNLGANAVSFSDTATVPTAGVTAGNQSTILPAPASGQPDRSYLRANATYTFIAATGATFPPACGAPCRSGSWGSSPTSSCS